MGIQHHTSTDGKMIGAREVAWQSKSGKFYRSKRPITSIEELNRTVARRTSMGDAVYQSVYRFANFKDHSTAIIDKIYVDLDNKHDPQLALNDAAKIADYIGDHSITYYSGYKGVGMLIRCDPVDLIPSMKKSVLRRFTLDLVDKCGVVTADAAVMGDISRVHRVIDSRHKTTGLYAIGISQSELSELSIDEIKEMATEPRQLDQAGNPSSRVAEQLLTI